MAASPNSFCLNLLLYVFLKTIINYFLEIKYIRKIGFSFLKQQKDMELLENFRRLHTPRITFRYTSCYFMGDKVL
jgi:hypothetical protein